jgi:hypothetical protein
MATQVFYIDLGGTLANIGAIRYGWRGHENSYDNIGSAMGVNKVTDTTQGIVFGANRPKPIPVRINFRTGNASGLFGSSNATRSVTRWAEPDKIGDLTLGGAINGKKIKIGPNSTEYDINSVSILGVNR